MSRSSNSEGCNGPPSAASCLVAGARSAGSQSRPAGRSVWSIRERVASPSANTRTRGGLGGAHQADNNLRPVGAVVAAVAMLRQFAAAPFEISGGDVVEQQRAILEV